MASPSLLPSLLFLLLTTTTLLVPPASSTSRRPLDQRPVQTGFRVGIRHVDSSRNFTKLQLLQRAINRGRNRMERLSALIAATATGLNDIQAPVHVGDGEFLMDLSMGTPSVPFSAIMDTGSDLIWTQCKPCMKCFDQPTPIFDPKESSSFSNISCSSELCESLGTLFRCNNGCEYLYTYGDESSTQGFMAMDTFTFGDESVQQATIPNIGFGCGENNQGTGLNQGAGIVGLGRGPLSLVSQVGSRKFSYCLTSIDENKTSSLLFGSLADLNFTNGVIHGTPLIQNPFQPSFYYLSLEGITVGETLLPISKSLFELGEDGTGGLIIDSGTTITHLHEDGFDVLKREFMSQMKLRVSRSDSIGLDLCFDLPSQNATEIEVPKLKFHFKGLDLELPGDNYMIADPGMGLICLAMGASGSLSIFGNIQQQNMLVLHDLEKETLSFVHTQCDQL